MSTTDSRGGPKATLLTVQAGVEGTSARFLKFQANTGTSTQGAPASPVIIYNGDSAALSVAVNREPSLVADYDFKVAAGGLIDISFGGLIEITEVSLYLPGGSSYEDVKVNGWV